MQQAGEEISYVLVPADTSQPLQELTARRGTTGDILTEHLTAAFSKQQSDVDISLLQSSAALLGSADASVSHESLQKVASQASVEVFPLVHPSPSNHFTGVNIYLDEVGMLKRLRLNTRASKYAELAGFHPAPQFYGDVYLGRIHKSGGRIINQSFVHGMDTALDAPWLKAAVTENLEHQQQQQIMNHRGTQPAVAGSDGTVQQEEGYSWTQTEEELEVVVPIEEGIGKDVQVKFRPQALEVYVRNKEPLVLLKLFERIDVDSGTWTIDRSSTPTKIVISMEKMEQALWPRIRD